MNMTRKPAILTTASLPALPSKTFPRTGYAPSAAQAKTSSALLNNLYGLISPKLVIFEVSGCHTFATDKTESQNGNQKTFFVACADSVLQLFTQCAEADPWRLRRSGSQPQSRPPGRILPTMWMSTATARSQTKRLPRLFMNFFAPERTSLTTNIITLSLR